MIKDKPKMHITFRIDEQVLDKLKSEATSKNIPLNLVVNQALEQYTNWDSISREGGFLFVRKPLLKEFLENFTENEIVVISEKIAKISTKYSVMVIMNKYDLESCLNFMVLFIRKSYTYKHTISGTVHKFIIEHDLNKKWSIYLATLYKYIFDEFTVKIINFDVSENMLTFEIDIPSNIKLFY